MLICTTLSNILIFSYLQREKITDEFDGPNDIAGSGSVWSDSGCNSSVTTESITEADFLDIHQDFKVHNYTMSEIKLISNT